MSTVIFVVSVLGVLGGTLAKDEAVRDPPDCPKGEVYTTCGSSCPTTCETRGDTCKVCLAVCVEGCFCAGKTIRGPNGTCVEPRKCPPRTCGPNEEFVNCPPTCPPTEDCSNIWSRIDCSDPIDCCKPSCRCKTGFYRNAQKKCISTQACINNSRCSDPNAITKECAPNEACRPTCAQPTPGPCPRNCVVNGCECPPGFVLSERGGRCIKIEDCPLTNVTCNGDPNAVIKANPLACPSTCDAPNAAPLCKKLGPAVGCECKPGYLLSKDGGTCILPDQCPGGNPCEENANFVGCKIECPNNQCPVDDRRGIIACDPPYPCPSGCICKLNHRRSIDGKCILASNCPPVNCTRQNEIWSPCPSECRREDCADVNNQPTTCNTLVLNCQPQCICKKGHFRNNKGLCIPASQCPNQRCSDPNAERVECAPAPNCRATCAVPNPGPCILSCAINECVCKKGYILSKKGGKCVPIEKCTTKPIKCKKNEVYRPCRIICPPQTCESIYSSYDCSKVKTKCEPGCDCISEYLRNGTDTDLCIPSELCPPPKPICGVNEHYESNSNKCDLTCKNKDNQAEIGPCPTSSGCFCDCGFVRNNKGICVKPRECPKPIICPANEVLSECYNTCLTTCRTRIRGDGRVCHTACIDSGCVCKSGFLRHDNGTCVPVSECSPPQCNKNETYSRCGTACPTTCQNRGDNCTACTEQCVEDCFCTKGFVRADDGTCVNPKECRLRTCKDSNEIFDKCPPSCPATDGCSLLWSKFNCTGAVRCCKPQCRCKPGLYRGPSGTCITGSQCINGNGAKARAVAGPGYASAYAEAENSAAEATA